MSRFGHLEFEDNKKRPREQAPAPRMTGAIPVTAESLLASADEEYHWGHYETALRLYTRCLQESRSAVAAWVGQVQMLIQLGEYHEARLWSDKALELFKNHGDLLAGKAQACARLKERKSAIACSDASMQAPGGSPYRWQVRGEVLLAHRKSAYDACFKRSLTETGATWFDAVAVSEIYLYYHKPASALEYAAQAVNSNPQAGYAWFIQGACQQALGMKPLAVTSFSRCLEIRPQFSPARIAIDEMDQESFLKRLFRRLRG